MRGRLLAIGMAAAAALSLSGCFTLRGFSWSSPVGTPGKNVVGELTVGPANPPGSPGPLAHHRDFPFTMVGLSSSGQLSLGTGSKWDAKGAFNGPKPFIPDAQLRDYIFSSGRCDLTDHSTNTVPLDSQAYKWFLLRTEAPVSDKGQIAKTAIEKIRLRVAKSVPLTDVDNVIFVTGAWFDTNHNLTPDDGDDIGCGGQLNCALPIKAG